MNQLFVAPIEDDGIKRARLSLELMDEAMRRLPKAANGFVHPKGIGVLEDAGRQAGYSIDAPLVMPAGGCEAYDLGEVADDIPRWIPAQITFWRA